MMDKKQTKGKKQTVIKTQKDTPNNAIFIMKSPVLLVYPLGQSAQTNVNHEAIRDTPRNVLCKSPRSFSIK